LTRSSNDKTSWTPTTTTQTSAHWPGDSATAQFSCGAALETVRNRNVRWVIEQYAHALDDAPEEKPED